VKSFASKILRACKKFTEEFGVQSVTCGIPITELNKRD
jgi:hypothetical protein